MLKLQNKVLFQKDHHGKIVIGDQTPAHARTGDLN